MELCIVSSNVDFIAIKSPFCSTCAENKLNMKIYKRIIISGPEYGVLAGKHQIRGYSIKCECST